MELMDLTVSNGNVLRATMDHEYCTSVELIVDGQVVRIWHWSDWNDSPMQVMGEILYEAGVAPSTRMLATDPLSETTESLLGEFGIDLTEL